MSKELNMRFVADPVLFTADRPVVAPPHQAEASQVKNWDNVSKQFKGVPGKLRIIAGDLTDVGDYCKMSLEYENVASKIQVGWMAMYYLPWLANNHVRTTLRPRSLKTREGTDKLKEVTKFGKISDYQDVDDPDIFFTAAVDGCMVSVMGPVDEPVVFHSNAMDVETNSHLGSREDERITHMNKDLGSFVQQKPKLPISQTQATGAKAATAYMYMPMERNIELQSKGYQKISADKIRKDKKLLGTIFAKRTGRNWAFYYERIVISDVASFEEEEMNGKMILFPMAPQQKYRLDVPVQEFWPTGPGHVLF